MEEVDGEGAFPAAKDLVACAGGAYEPEELLQTERLILSALHWRVHVVTPMHHVQLLERHTASAAELKKRNVTESLVQLYLTFFAELTLQEQGLIGYPPALMGAAIVATTRRVLKLTPTWTDELAAFTQLSNDAVLPCHHALWEDYHRMYPTRTSAEVVLSPNSLYEFVAHAAGAKPAAADEQPLHKRAAPSEADADAPVAKKRRRVPLSKRTEVNSAQ